MTATIDSDPDARRPGRWLRWVGPLVGAVIFLAAGLAISGELKGIHWHQVNAAADATPVSALGLALIALAVSLGVASTFDRFALACLDRTVSWRRTAVTSITAFALTNAGPPGLALAGGLRYRAYQDDGLSGGDVALVGTAGTGISLIGGLAVIGIGTAGVVADVAARAHLPLWTGLLLGVLGLKALAVYVLAPRVGWLGQFLPERRVRLAIVLASTVHWIAAAAILYVLLPAAGRGELLHFLPVFGIAGLIGAISGLPGGIGVFDAVMIAVIGPATGTAEVAGALILYRLIYGLGPLLIAGLLTAASAYRTRRPAGLGERALQASEAVWREVAPPLFALLTFGAGTLTLLSAATPDSVPHLALLASLAPAGLIDLSHFVASLAGVVLLFLAFGLLGRLRRAWRATVITLLAAAAACVLKGLGYGEALMLSAVALLLLVSRPAFHREAGLGSAAIGPGAVAAIVVVLGAAGWLGLFAYQDVAYRDDLWWTFLTEQNAPRFLRAAVGAAALAVLLFAWRLSRPGQVSPGQPDAADLARAEAILAVADDPAPDANLAFLGDKSLLFSPSGRSFIQYGVRGRAWVAMGEPVGPREDRSVAIWAFRELCDRHGARPVFYGVRRRNLPDFIDCGLVASKIGETAMVDLADFGLEGPDRAPLRHTINRGERDGATFDIIPPEGFDAVADDLQTVSDAWLAGHQGVEKGFSLGRFDRAYLRRFPTAVLRVDGHIVAFANLWRTPDGRVLSIDLMRYGPGAPKNAMDLLFIRLMQWGKTNGFAECDMSMAPLSGLDPHRLSSPVTRLGSFVYAEGGGLYGFEGLRAFKQKFLPRWDPVYIAAPAGWMLGPALADAALLSSGGLLGALR